MSATSMVLCVGVGGFYFNSFTAGNDMLGEQVQPNPEIVVGSNEQVKGRVQEKVV